MTRTKKLILIVLAILMALVAGALIACETEKNTEAEDEDAYDTKLYSDYIILSDDDCSDKWDEIIGNSGEAKVFSDYAIDRATSSLQANEAYYLVCSYRLFSDEHNPKTLFDYFTRTISFTMLFDDGSVRYDAVGVYDASFFYRSTNERFNVPMRTNWSGFDYYSSFSDNYDGAIWQYSGCFAMRFSPQSNGTLFVHFDLSHATRESACENETKACYVGSTKLSGTEAKINNVSVMYLTEQVYQSTSEYTNLHLTTEPYFENGVAYMVVDFDFNATEDNDGRSTIKAVIGVPRADLGATIAEVSSGDIFESTSKNGETQMSAVFKVPPTAAENKSIRMIVRLTLLDDAKYAFTYENIDVLFAGESNAFAAGKICSSYSFQKGTLLRFEKNNYNKYTVVGINDPTVESVVVPEMYNGYDVSQIDKDVFSDCSNLKSIRIPSTVTSIEDRALENCMELESIAIPFAEIKNLFWGSLPSSLKSVEIVDGATSIANNAFYNCGNLTDIIISSSIKSIGEYAFWNCSNLQSVVFAENSRLDTIDSMAFNCCGGLTSIEIPSSVKSIGELAFYKCSSLQSVVFAENSQLATIGKRAFNSCSNLTNIEIPSSVTTIGEDAFSCSGLDSITVAEGNSVYHSNGNCLIETATKKLLVGCKNSVIPTDGSVVSIGPKAFLDCSSLKSISIPSSVTSIGERAFLDCSSLQSVVFANNSRLATINEWAFYGCSSLTSIEIPSDVKSIGEQVFYNCDSLQSVIFAENSLLTAIGSYAFCGCSSLSSIEIPSSVKSIYSSAFLICSGLQNVVFANNSQLATIGEHAFRGCGLTSIEIPQRVASN